MLRRWKLSRLSPPQLVAVSFILAILAGTALLSLPVAHAPGRDVTFLQALFTATSAICVTGLTVVDTGETYSIFGEVVILVLLQVGGLGIVAFGTLFATLVGRRLGFGERLRVAEQVGAFELGGIGRLIRTVVLYTLLIEAIGALLLYLRFGPLEGWGAGAYYAVFYAISAFNNGGFSIYSDSLMRFARDPLVNLTVAGLVLIGTLGFLVIMNLLAWRPGRRGHTLTLQTKIVLVVSGALLLLGMLAFALIEWSNPNTIGPLGTVDKLVASFFYSTTPRSSGFNTLDYTQMHPATNFLTILLMFIGSSPASTGGGIKVTTFFVLVVASWSFVRGRGEPIAFRRRIGTDVIIRAVVVTFMSLGLVNGALILLVLTQPGVPFLNLFFEAVSAFGTVGLSMNTTGALNEWGQIILIFLMYLGRVGLFTFVLALAAPTRHNLVSYPAEKNIIVG